MAYFNEDWVALKLEEWAKWAGDGVGYARSLGVMERIQRAMEDLVPFPVIAADADVTDRALRLMPVVSVIALVHHHRAPFPSWWRHHKNLKSRRRHVHNLTKQAHHDFVARWREQKIAAALLHDANDATQNRPNSNTGAEFRAFR